MKSRVQVMKFGVIILLFFMLSMSLVSTTYAASKTIYVQDSTYHTGRVYTNGQCTTDDILIDGDFLSVGEASGWARFSTSSIPDNATINSVTIYVKTYFINVNGVNTDIVDIEHDPTNGNCSQIWSDIHSGNEFKSNYVFSGDHNSWKAIALNSTAVQNLQNNLSSNWFAVGFKHDDSDIYRSVNIEGHTDLERPYIVVGYTVPDADVEYTLYRISDTSGSNNTSNPGAIKATFSKGETVRVTLKANNISTSVPVESVLNLRGPDNSTMEYDSDVEGENNSYDSPLNNGETDYYSFNWTIPSNAPAGWYDVLGSIRHGDVWDTVLDTTAPGRGDEDWENAIISDQFQILAGVPDIDVQPSSLAFTREESTSTVLESEIIVLDLNIPEQVQENEHQKLYNLLKENERIPVIVHLKNPKHFFSSKDHLAISISELQNLVLNQLTDDEFILTKKFVLSSSFVGEVTIHGLDKLLEMQEVIIVYKDIQTSGVLNESIPLINADDVHNMGFTGDGVTVAVLDTGIDTDHPDLSDDLLGEHCFTQGACPPNDTNESTDADDGHGHGTAVSGIISSNGTVAPEGVAPDAGIVAIKILANNNSGSLNDIALGIDWVTAHQTDFDISVINISVGSNTLYTNNCDANFPALATAVNTAVANGITIFAAAGNDGSGTQMSAPACLTNVISVGAVYDDDVGSRTWCLERDSNNNCISNCTDANSSADMVTCFSNSNNLLDIMAPSFRSNTCALNGGERNDFGGTSAASPHAAAVAALMIEADPGLDPATIETNLEDSGVDVTDQKNNLTFPRIDALAAVELGGSIIISNAGTSNLNIDDIRIENGACWLSVPEPHNFSIAEGEFEVKLVSVDHSCVGEGTYNDAILIDSNDPDLNENPYRIPVTLEVQKDPDQDVGPIEFHSYRIDDDNSTSSGDNDGIPECGETIELPVTLKNLGTEDALDVEAILSTSDSYINITDDDRAWNTIIAGGTAESSDYDFEISESTPNGHVVDFDLDITAYNGGPWTDSFDMTIYCPTPELSVNPTSHDFGTKDPGRLIHGSFNIQNTGGGTLSWNVSESIAWVTSVTPASGTTTTETDSVTVSINTTGLTPGQHYDGYINVTSNGGSQQVYVEVTIASEDPVLYVTPTSHDFGTKDPGQTDSWIFNIQNIGGGTLSWNVSESIPWLSVTPSSGTTTTETDPVTVNINTTGLTPGQHYDGYIDVTSNGGSQQVYVEVTIASEDPVLYVNPTSHDFGMKDPGQTDSWSFNIQNIGGGTLSWNVSESIPWLSVTPSSGTTTTETDPVTVNINTTGLTPGQHYDGYIDVTSNGGSQQVYVEVFVDDFTNTIRINELDPYGNDEVEFYNYGNSPVVMTGWHLKAYLTSTSVHVDYTFPSFTLQPNAYVVLHENGILPTTLRPICI